MWILQLGYTITMAGVLSTTFEVGGVAGSASLGFLMDRYVIINPSFFLFFLSFFLQCWHVSVFKCAKLCANKSYTLSLFFRFLGAGKTHWGVFLALVCCTISLVMFQLTSGWGWMFNVFFMLLAGVGNCGPDAFVSGSIAAELGARENAQSAVAGFINGTQLLNSF